MGCSSSAGRGCSNAPSDRGRWAATGSLKVDESYPSSLAGTLLLGALAGGYGLLVLGWKGLLERPLRSGALGSHWLTEGRRELSVVARGDAPPRRAGRRLWAARPRLEGAARTPPQIGGAGQPLAH